MFVFFIIYTNELYSIDINIPVLNKHIHIDICPEPSEWIKWGMRNKDKVTIAISQGLDKLNIWKERAQKKARSIPENRPYDYDQLLSVDNQDFFTVISGYSKRVSIGKIKNAMSVWIVDGEGIPYEYNPSNMEHNLSWIKQSFLGKSQKLCLSDDGTIGGIKDDGMIFL